VGKAFCPLIFLYCPSFLTHSLFAFFFFGKNKKQTKRRGCGRGSGLSRKMKGKGKRKLKRGIKKKEKGEVKFILYIVSLRRLDLFHKVCVGDTIIRVSPIYIEMLLKHVHEIKSAVNRYNIRPVLLKVGCHVKTKECPHL
jgi:hypothetical protein